MALADELTWRSEPDSAAWNLSDRNWSNAAGASVSWAEASDAVFGESSRKTIDVAEGVTVSNLTFTANGYTLDGAGPMTLARTGSAPSWTWQVDAGVTSRVSTVVGTVHTESGFDGTLLKSGDGVLQLAGTTTVLRLHVQAGELDLTGAHLTTAKLRASLAGNEATLRVDGTRLSSVRSSNGILIGDAVTFHTALIGAGGLELNVTNESEIVQDFSTAPGVETDGGLVKDGAALVRLTGNSTFNGGVLVRTGQLRVNNDKALGTGDVVLSPNASFFVYGGRVCPANKIVQSADSYVGSMGDGTDCLVLTAVGTTDGNTDGVFELGRNNNALSRAVLSLTATNSEPIGAFSLKGNLDLTIDGGVLTARPTASATFFNTTNFSTTNTPIAKVGSSGLVFDTNGAMTELGLPLDMSLRVTNVVVEAEAFTNPSFEEGTAGWAFTNASGDSDSKRQANSSTYTSSDEDRTTNGTYYATMRRKSSLSTTFTAAEDGDYRVAFEMGCRTGDYGSYAMTVTVTIDGVHRYVIDPRSSRYSFTRFETDIYSLAKGDHTLSITTDNGNGKQFGTLLFDAFSLERIPSITSPRVEKRGEGQLGIDALATDGEVAVTGGTLALREPQIDGASLTVAEGAGLLLGGGCVSNATVTVAAQGRLTFAETSLGANLVRNGSFEEDVTTGYRTNITAWTASFTGAHRSPSGVQKNGSDISKEGPVLTSAGTQTAYLRFDTRISQTIDVPEAGTYRLSFLRAPRNYVNSDQLALRVTMDGTTIASIAPHTKNVFTSSEMDLELEKGSHALSFRAMGGTSQYEMLLLDDVRLERVYTGVMPDASGSVFNLASGSTLVVPDTGTLVLDTVFVDGKSVRGNASALKAAGVTVTGTGKIRIGAPLGLVIYVR